MRIQAIYRHYWPDTTPYATILRGMLERLAADGHDVEVLAAQPSYNDQVQPQQHARETIEGVKVRRVWLFPERKSNWFIRGINFVLFLSRAVIHCWRSEPADVVIGSSYPPVLMGIALRWIKRLTGAPFIYHCQDLHPECGRLIGKIRSRRFFDWLSIEEEKTCDAATRVVVLSEDMKDTVVRRGVPRRYVEVINNFAIESRHVRQAQDTTCETPQPDENKTAFRVLFAGNMGTFQGLNRIIAAAHELRAEEDIQFLFMGTGEQTNNLRRLAGDLLGRTVHFLGHHPKEVAFSCMTSSNLGVVALSKGVYQYAFPSKVMTYLAAGLPILAVVEPRSELAHLIRKEKLGYVAADGDPKAIAEAILRAKKARDDGLELAAHELQQLGQELFGRDTTLEKWSELFEAFAPHSERNPKTMNRRTAA